MELEEADHIHGLLWAVREMRRGEESTARRRIDALPDQLQALFRAPLADLCRSLAERLTITSQDPRAADACIRFYGLGRLPEALPEIAASLPRAGRHHGSLQVRRVKQLIEQAERGLAHELAASPVDLAPKAPGPPVDEVLATVSPVWSRLGILLRAWADVPDGDQQSAAALLLFEQEAGLRPPSTRPVLHRETRRRLRRRARAILSVALERSAGAADHRSPPHLDPAAELLLGPRQMVASGDIVSALDTVLRSSRRSRGPDPDALAVVCGYARDLVHTGSPDAPALLGVMRLAVIRGSDRLPPALVMRVLALSTIRARLQDDPAGFPAAWEGLRLGCMSLDGGRQGSDVAPVVSQALRTLQELAELQDRLGFADAAMRTLDRAYDLLAEHGDPEAEEEPKGWAQQLLYTQSMVQRHAALSQPNPRTWLREAQRAAARSAELVRGGDLLPEEWGLSAEAVLANAVVDEAELELAAGATGRAREAVCRARAVIARNELAWRCYGAPKILMSQSGRLATIRAACRLALATGDLDDYLLHRERVQRAVGAWMLPADIEELDAMEAAAARRGVERVHLSAPGVSPERRIGQRMWAIGVASTAAARPPD
jgi:hypothetical protein